MRTNLNLESIKNVLKTQLSTGGKSYAYSEILKSVKEDRQNIVFLYEFLRKALDSRSSLEVYNALETFEFLILDSVEFATSCQTVGQKIVFAIFNLAVKKSSWKQFKLKNPKWKTNIRYLAQKILMGLAVLFQQTRFEKIFKHIRNQMEMKLDVPLVKHEDLAEYEEIEPVLLVALEGQSIVSKQNQPASSGFFTFDTMSLSENVRLLAEIFKANPELRGEELKTNEVVSIIMEKIKNDQQNLQLAIKETPNQSTALHMIRLNEQIDELNDVFYTLISQIKTEPIYKAIPVQDKSSEEFAPTNVDIFSALDSLQLTIDAANQKELLQRDPWDEFDTMLKKETTQIAKNMIENDDDHIQDENIKKLTKEDAEFLFK